MRKFYGAENNFTGAAELDHERGEVGVLILIGFICIDVKMWNGL